MSEAFGVRRFASLHFLQNVVKDIFLLKDFGPRWISPFFVPLSCAVSLR